MTKQTEMFAGTETLNQAIGCGCYHKGEHGVILAYDTETYAEPMFIVNFNGRKAVIKATELGAQ